MPKSRPPYPEEFRREAVEMVRTGRKLGDVAVSLGVTEQSLRNWVKRDQLERRERDDGITVAEPTSSGSCGAGSSAWSRSAICSNEPRPSSRGRPRPGECLPDRLSGEGLGCTGLPVMRVVGGVPLGLLRVVDPGAV